MWAAADRPMKAAADRPMKAPIEKLVRKCLIRKTRLSGWGSAEKRRRIAGQDAPLRRAMSPPEPVHPPTHRLVDRRTERV